jgi:hypothetical protein
MKKTDSSCSHERLN